MLLVQCKMPEQAKGSCTMIQAFQFLHTALLRFERTQFPVTVCLFCSLQSSEYGLYSEDCNEQNRRYVSEELAAFVFRTEE
jgi:hypothetical protein